MSETKKPTPKQVEKALAPYEDAVGRYRANGLDRAQLEAELKAADEAAFTECKNLNASVIAGMRIDADEAIIINVWRDGAEIKSAHAIIELAGDVEGQIDAASIDTDGDVEVPADWRAQPTWTTTFEGISTGMAALAGRYAEDIDARLSGEITTEELVARIEAISPKLEGDMAHVATVAMTLPDGKRLVIDGSYNRQFDPVVNVVVIG
jgi:cytoskeletal protein CcmA (bactofilin family)